MSRKDRQQEHKAMSSFARQVTDWQITHGRHHLPWQDSEDPYRIWLSEIMLQQTTVRTVVKYYNTFLERFPCLSSLADAHEDDVLQRWSGLGYYRRARNLHSAARQIVNNGGRFPCSYEDLLGLPGVGRSTAGAILVFAFGKVYPILDGNVKRVLARYFCIECPLSSASVNKKLWRLSEKLLPKTNIRPYTQGLMDLGATICTKSKPACVMCPLQRGCKSLKEGKCAAVPVRKKRPLTPLKKVYMLVCINNGYLMMEKRGYKGVWGGLLSFPEVNSRVQVEKKWLDNSHLEFTNISYLNSFKHGFSHFRLMIYPVVAESKYRHAFFKGKQVCWLTYQDALQAAIPTAIRKIINVGLLGCTDG